MAAKAHPMIGLTLSGGGARGLAHIGVLKVLQRADVRVDCVTGSSMGGILAAAYAAGFSPAELEAEALHMACWRRLVPLIDFSPPRRGLLAGRKLRAYLTKFFPPDLTFADLHLPLIVEGVDLRTGEEVPLSEGPVLDAVMATCAYPGVFPPVEWQGRRLVDGGLLDNLPVDSARALGADIVIASDTDALGDEAQFDCAGSSSHVPGFLQTAWGAISILTMARARAKLQTEAPDIMIHPKLGPEIGIFSSFTHAAEVIAVGEKAAEQALSRLSRLRARALPEVPPLAAAIELANLPCAFQQMA